ncbi:hypothetical protein [Inhella proteolytica]|uniref:Uncharacterized protein n=1 Tax=Inhella proteolytica TaxID=2795029 RepID=A0A931NIC7_9BURK|nr:hypothetical protein [Inhella proteolytica]MBH9578703.1 hypothetical protein [Inhella proteolytica]
MLVLLPGLVATGYLLGRRVAGSHGSRVLAVCDAHGLLTLTVATALAAFWMVPAALDWAALTSLGSAARHLSLLSLGAVLAWRLHRMAIETLLFLAGNTAWMLITAGMLIASSESRLCVSYLWEEQALAGWSLAVGGVALGALAILRALDQPMQAGKAARAAGHR